MANRLIFCGWPPSGAGQPQKIKQFAKFFDLMGIQRHLKAVGIFTRLNYRDGKSIYLKDIPRTLKYIITVAENYPEIIFLVKSLIVTL